MEGGGLVAMDAYGILEIPPSTVNTMMEMDHTQFHSDECIPAAPYENGLAMGSNNFGDVSDHPCVSDAVDTLNTDMLTNADPADAADVVSTFATSVLPAPNPLAATCMEMPGMSVEQIATAVSAACSSPVADVLLCANDGSSEVSAASCVPAKKSCCPPKTKIIRVVFRKDSMHEILGGGNLADLLLWKSWLLSSLIVFSATFVWAFFQFSSYSLVSICAIITLLVLTNVTFIIDFLPPILPFLELKEDEVRRLASEFRIVANKYFAVLHYVAVGGSFKMFMKTLLYLYVVSKIGRWFDFFTLLFVILILAFTVPKAYDIFESDVDRAADLALEQSRKYYIAADMAVKSKIPIIQKINSRKQKAQ